MRKTASILVVSLLLITSVVPARAQGGAVAGLQQFLRSLAAGDDVAAWRCLTRASKAGIAHLTWVEMKEPKVPERDVATMYATENRELLKTFFDALRKSIGPSELLKSHLAQGQYQGHTVVVVEAPTPSVYVMVDEGGWKVGYMETLRLKAPPASGAAPASLRRMLTANDWAIDFKGQSYGTIRFKPDGTCMKAGQDGLFASNGTWKLEGDRLTLDFPSEGPAFSGPVKADGKSLVVTFADGAITYRYTPLPAR